MPLLNSDDYRPAFPFTRPHFSTVYPTLFRGKAPLAYQRKTVELPDGDFIYVDRLKNKSSKAVIICHGLEGNSGSQYVLGIADMFYKAGWDIAAMNFRGCGGVPNRLPSFYHSGLTGDLNRVVASVLEEGFEDIRLIGFSLGGNLILKYLGEKKYSEAERVKGAVVFSVPVDLADSSRQLLKKKNYIYTKRFLLKLGKKLKEKSKIFPEEIDIEPMKKIRNLMEFDNLYTAPLHGFKNAEDYYRKNSSLQFLSGISIPVLLVNAENDPFLGPNCYPLEKAEKNRFLHLAIPRYGGHVGFWLPGGVYYSEKTALRFLEGI